jgi:hypothetical protein
VALATLLRTELRRLAQQQLKPIAARLRKATRQLSQLRRAVRAQRRVLDRLQRNPRPGARRRRLALSASRRTALRLQGQYMGHIRGLKPRDKARVKILRLAKGFPAAIRFAKKLASRAAGRPGARAR